MNMLKSFANLNTRVSISTNIFDTVRRTPMGDIVTTRRRFNHRFDRPVEHVTLECPRAII